MPHPAQEPYHDALDLDSFESTTSFSTQDWGWPYDVSGSSSQDVGGSINRPLVVPDTLLDLGQPSEIPDAANKVDLQSLIKPAAEEAWRPPLLPRSGNISHGYNNNLYARSTGVRTEPLHDEETCRIIGSDFVSNFDSGFYSRQDLGRDDQSEISAKSGAHPGAAQSRPLAGRNVSDSQVTAHNGKRRRSSQPLPVCSVCKVFWPKNRSDQTYVSCSCLHQDVFADQPQQARKEAYQTIQVPSRRMHRKRRRILDRK